MIAVGLMSGTSLDGIDAALVRIVPTTQSYEVELLDFRTIPFAPELRRRLIEALPPNTGSVELAAELHRELGDAFASAAMQVAGGRPVDYVASHGQTLWHDGTRHVSLQLADAFAIREALSTTVCFDFRSGDLAAGGCGAPLVPYVDALLLASADEDRVAVNLGGIANLTVIPRQGATVAFDSGPANMLLDAFVSERTRGKCLYDEGGAAAMQGHVHEPTLAEMLGDPYFALPPPKSTGRERFGAQFFAERAQGLSGLSLEDGAATLAELTAATVANAVTACAAPHSRVLLSGGGAKNAAILRALRQRLPGFTVEPSSTMNVNPDAKEAVAFAVLGYETLRERVANVPRVTGARRAVSLGAIAPCGLRALLLKVDAECALP